MRKFLTSILLLLVFSGVAFADEIRPGYLELKENTTDEAIPKVVGVGDLVGQYHIETIAQCENSTYNDLTSNMVGVGYIDLYLQYAPDTSYENVTFIPTFSQCEKVELSVNTFGPAIEYVVDVVGHANGVEYPEFYDVSLDNVAINETFELEYPPVNISGDVFNETWSVTAEQYKDTLVILRGTGDITTLDFTFDDCNATLDHGLADGYGLWSVCISPSQCARQCKCIGHQAIDCPFFGRLQLDLFSQCLFLCRHPGALL